jgi:hypothetical protein
LAISAIVISVIALLFTIFSFWWMNWRPGNLTLSEVRTYAAVSSGNSLVMQLPVVFFNSGAMPVLVNNLRLTFPDHGKEHTALFFNNTVEKLGTDQGSAMATPFPVRGGEALLRICGFYRIRAGFVFEVGEYEINIEGKLDGNPDWKVLKTFTQKVRKSQVDILNSRLVPQDNEPQLSQS